MKKKNKNQVWVNLSPRKKLVLDAYIYAKGLKRTAVLRIFVYEKLEELIKNALVTDTEISRYNKFIKEHGLRQNSND